MWLLITWYIDKSWDSHIVWMNNRSQTPLNSVFHTMPLPFLFPFPSNIIQDGHRTNKLINYLGPFIQRNPKWRGKEKKIQQKCLRTKKYFKGFEKKKIKSNYYKVYSLWWTKYQSIQRLILQYNSVSQISMIFLKKYRSLIVILSWNN